MVVIPLEEEGRGKPTRAIFSFSDVSDKARRADVPVERRRDQAEQLLGHFMICEGRTKEPSIQAVSTRFSSLTGTGAASEPRRPDDVLSLARRLPERSAAPFAGFSGGEVLGYSPLCLGSPTSDRRSMRNLSLGVQSGKAFATNLLAFKRYGGHWPLDRRHFQMLMSPFFIDGRSGDPIWLSIHGMPMYPVREGGSKVQSGSVWADAGDSRPRSQANYLFSGDPVTMLCLLTEITSSKQRRVGKYQLGRVIGRGASGVVRMGRDTQTGDVVAVKMINASNFRSIQVGSRCCRRRCCCYRCWWPPASATGAQYPTVTPWSVSARRRSSWFKRRCVF